MIRHVVDVSNVDRDGYVIDPTLARHCTIQHAQLAELSGPIDPLTHLNRDFPQHAIGDCVIAAQLQVGADVLTRTDGSALLASSRPRSFLSMGHVDIDRRRAEWLTAHRARREEVEGAAG